MFGYIKPYEDELKVRNFKLYRSLYCGLCKSAGKNISIFSRFFLSYDYTFFAAVRMVFERTPYTFKKSRCGFHLFAKKDIIADNSAISLSCAIFSILTYYKLLDNIKDEVFFKSLGARFLLPFASHMRKKALKRGFSDADMIISDCMEQIGNLEKRKDVSSCEISAVFGDMMAYLLKLGLKAEDKDDAEVVGFEIGRFIYMADALDDLEKDEKRNRFNPYLNEYKDSITARTELYKQKNILVHGTDVAADIISTRMKSLDQQHRDLCEIIQNILYLGCPSVIDGIFDKNKPGNCSENCKNGFGKEQ
ncbi:MAG: hypothetical protein IKI97_03320 [Clostridia bacterium]|nr:hypothetical protein [Clostridia bacterium]